MTTWVSKAVSLTTLNLLSVLCAFCEGVPNCRSFEKPTMEGYLRLLEKGNMGVETALIDLGLEGNQEVNFIPHKSQPTMESLTAEYLRAKKVALGAQIFGVGLLENLTLELMSFLELLASLLYKRKIRVEADANQVGRALQIRIQHIKNWYESIGEVSD